jgi:hypothetical protein
MPAQLALIGEELAKLKRGGDRKSGKYQSRLDDFDSRTQQDIADKLGIHRSLISDARRLKQTAIAAKKVDALARRSTFDIRATVAIVSRGECFLAD